MRKYRWVLASVLLLLTVGAARGEPKLILPSDPDGSEIRTEAAILLRHIARNESAAARAQVSGDDDQRALLEAFLNWAAATENLERAAIAKYSLPDRKQINFSAADMYNVRANSVAAKYIVIDGKHASLAAGGLFDEGMLLDRVHGAWQVTELATSPARARALRKCIDEMTQTSADLQRDLAGGKFATPQAFDETANAAFTAVLRKFGAEMTAAPPMSVRSLQPSIVKPLTIGAMRAMFGKPLEGKETSAWVAAQTGVPLVRQTGEWTILATAEGGHALGFFRKRLSNVWFYAKDNGGFRQYRGELPDGLSFADGRAEIERKLGAPPEGTGGGDAPFQAVYRAKGVFITYAGDEPRDVNCKIGFVTLAVPDATAPSAVPVRPPRLTIQLVADETQTRADDPQVQTLNQPGTNLPVMVYRKVLLDESAFRCVSAAPAERTLHLEATDAGGKLLHEISIQNVGKKLAVVFDGQLLIAAVVRDPLTKYVALSMEKDATPTAVRDLSGKLTAAIFALREAPTTAPGDDKVKR